MVKIVVVKKALFEDIITKELGNTNEFSVCERFFEGQEFILKSIGEIPDGFCAWAWADIQRDIAMIEYGATPEPPLSNPQSIYSCCGEGLRPVIFKIEKINS